MSNLTNLIGRLEQAERGATPGPWEQNDCDLNRVDNARTGNCIAATWPEGEEGVPGAHYTNAKFIALSRNALPALLRILKLHREALSQLCDCANLAEDGECMSCLTLSEAERIAGECNG